jgi:hypothetical protein
MTEPTHRPAAGRCPLRRALMIAIPVLVVVALAAIAAFSASPATAHVSYGQPCDCHGPTQTPTVTVATSKKAVKAKASIKVTGKVVPGYAGLRADLAQQDYVEDGQDGDTERHLGSLDDVEGAHGEGQVLLPPLLPG